MNHIRPVFLKLALTASMLLWASIAVTPATAASIQYSFTGYVDHVHNQLSSQFNTSQLMSGTMTVNTADTFSPITNTTFGKYTITNFSLNIGGYTATMGTSGQVDIRNASLSGLDRFKMEVNAPNGLNVNFLAPRLFNFELRGPNTQFDTDALPTTVPSIATFTNFNRWHLVFGPGNGHVVRGDMISLTAVPLPAAVILFGAGLIALVGLGAGNWRQKKNTIA